MASKFSSNYIAHKRLLLPFIVVHPSSKYQSAALWVFLANVCVSGRGVVAVYLIAFKQACIPHWLRCIFYFCLCLLVMRTHSVLQC